MGKFMWKKRTADHVAVMEGCLGVRTRAKTFSVEKQHSCILRKALLDQQQASMDSSSIEARLKNGKHEDANEAADATVTATNEEAEPENPSRMDMEEGSAEQPMNPRSLEEAQNSLGEQQQQDQEATSTSNSSSCVQEGDRDEVVEGTGANLRLLRESHSDSCLRRERGPIAVAHSRSNSDSFTQEQASSFVGGLGSEKPEQQSLEPLRTDSQRVEENRPQVSTKEIEASYGDNTVVLSASAKERTSSCNVCQALSVTNDDRERGEEQPGSSSLRLHYNHGPTDCGPGWRHRVGSSAPTADEIEEFFAGVEQEKDDRKRFVDKYNFDIFNEAPLPGRFEWVRFNS